LRSFDEVRGYQHQFDIQFSVIDLERRFIYHDWDDMIGNYAPKVLNDVFTHDTGAIS